MSETSSGVPILPTGMTNEVFYKEQAEYWKQIAREDRARIQELESELASCRECRANLDCLSRGAVPVRDDGAERIRDLTDALESIRQFGSDTLSGRADGPDDREWQREAVREMTARASAALQPKDTAK